MFSAISELLLTPRKGFGVSAAILTVPQSVVRLRLLTERFSRLPPILRNPLNPLFFSPRFIM